MMSHWQGWLYVAAVLIPLFAFAVEILFIRSLKRLTAYIATGAIGFSCLLSLVGLASVVLNGGFVGHHAKAEAKPAGEAAEGHAAEEDHGTGHRGFAWTGSANWVLIGGGMFARPEPVTTEAEPLPALAIPLAIHIDGLAVIMFSMVTFIATLIHVYSMGYMSDDPRYPRFFAYLSLFCFSMLGLVASANVFMVFMFWELVGVCSYLLIGFWYEDKKNTDAANKAFIVNRVGDVGMLVGLGLIWAYFGTFTIADINHGLSDKGLRSPAHMNRLVRATAHDDVTVHLPGAGEDAAADHGVAKTIPYWMLVVAGLGIFAGCMGKSAQFPLHVWLPDAMAGPTPVSALIHAATMVAAGVYLVGRFFPLFTNEVLLGIGYIGGLTLLIAATIAMVQTDYKKVLAYSTVSQLGFMMLALGVGGWAAGLFHLLTHAFFKALLFLCAGSVYHSVHTYEMPVLGGLWKKMPTTGWCMLIGTLAISGVPLFSGFYSKDAILANALYFIRYSPGNMLLFILPAVGAIITAFYMFRMWFLIFDGEPRGYPAQKEPAVEVEHGHFEAPADDHGHGHDAAHSHSPAHGHDTAHGHAAPAAAAHGHDHGHHGNPVDHAHESPPVMTIPLMILAAFSIFVGWSLIPFPIPGLPNWLILPVLEGMLEAGEPLEAVDVSNVKLMAMGASLLIAAGGIAAAIGYYSRWKILNPARLANRLGWFYTLFARKWYIDEIYNAAFVRPTLALARLVVMPFDKRIVDGMVDGSATATRGLSRFEGFFDKFAVDGLVNLVGWIVFALGDWGRGIQTGRLRSYLGMLAVAVVLLFAGVFLWVR